MGAFIFFRYVKINNNQFLFSETKLICETGMMTKPVVEGQKRCMDLIRECKGANNVPITKVIHCNTM